MSLFGPVLTFIVILTFLSQVTGEALFQLRLHNFTNSEGRDESKTCCGTQSLWSGECQGVCNTFFYVCMRHVVRSTPFFFFRRRLPACTGGALVTDVIVTNNLREENPVAWNFTISVLWQGKFSLVIEARHKNTNLTESPTKEIFRTIARFRQQSRLPIGEEWHKVDQVSSTGVDIGYSYRVICAPGFTGPKCGDKCPDAEDTQARFDCTEIGEKVCRAGWQGEDCEKPICREGCHKSRGYCEQPGVCQCRLGWVGDTCEECIPMPGCVHGSCNKTFECTCEEGWTGLFCNIPICKEGCDPRRGHCEDPGDCLCRIGWKGDLCKECKTLPGCQHGYCEKPLECKCFDGWKGMFCNIPVCHESCHPESGYCNIPGECRCHVGWYGENCDICHPYPGCQNGNCTKPWECVCQEGWGGYLCDERLNYCDNHSPCKNGATCVSRPKDENYYNCVCLTGFTGVNCETTIS